MEQQAAARDEIRFHRIVINAATVSEVDGHPLVTIPRSDIIQVRLTHGLLTERPVIALLAGIAVTAIGLFGIKLLAAVFLTDNPGFPKTGSLASVCIVFGPLLIYSAFRRGPILRIETSQGIRTLQFGKTLKPEDLPWFVERARAAGLTITAQ